MPPDDLFWGPRRVWRPATLGDMPRLPETGPTSSGFGGMVEGGRTSNPKRAVVSLDAGSRTVGGGGATAEAAGRDQSRSEEVQNQPLAPGSPLSPPCREVRSSSDRCDVLWQAEAGRARPGGGRSCARTFQHAGGFGIYRHLLEGHV